MLMFCMERGMTTRYRLEERLVKWYGDTVEHQAKLHVAVHEVHSMFTVAGRSVVLEDQKVNFK